MAKQTINVGTTANDGTGDKLNLAFSKANANFTELYSGKEPSISFAQPAQYFKGDKTWGNLLDDEDLQDTLGTKVNKGGITSSGLTTNSGILLGRKSANTGAIENLDPLEAKTLLLLDNVSNTSDANKPISTATKTALDAKEPTVTGGGVGQYYRGDKSFQDLNKTAVGLALVDNTSDLAKPISTLAQAALDGKEDKLVAPTTAPTTKFLNGSKAFVVVDKTTVGLSNVDNTADADKPVFTSTTAGIVPKSGGGTTKYLRADGTWAVPGGSGSSSVQTYAVKFYMNAVPTMAANARSRADVVTDDFTIVVGNSKAKVLVAPDADTVFNIAKNGTNIGTITFLAGETVGTIAVPTSSDRALVLADYLEIVSPAVQDSKLDKLVVVLHN